MVGRRDRFTFDKVTAVSTSGFSEGAVDYAKDKGIELRSVDEISAATVKDWFLPSSLGIYNQHGRLTHAELRVSGDDYKNYSEAFPRY